MDGGQWNADEDLPVFPPVVPCRGRLSRPDTLTDTSFTREELDALAPLTRCVRLSLRLNYPTAHAKLAIQRRIQAAHDLKYRSKDVK